MQREKVGVLNYLPCRLIDSTDFLTPKDSIVFDDASLIIRYRKEGETSFTVKTIVTEDWINVGEGWYDIRFTASELDTKKNFDYEVECSGCITFSRRIELVDNVEAVLKQDHTSVGA